MIFAPSQDKASQVNHRLDGTQIWQESWSDDTNLGNNLEKAAFTSSGSVTEIRNWGAKKMLPTHCQACHPSLWARGKSPCSSEISLLQAPSSSVCSSSQLWLSHQQFLHCALTDHVMYCPCMCVQVCIHVWVWKYVYVCVYSASLVRESWLLSSPCSTWNIWKILNQQRSV